MKLLPYLDHADLCRKYDAQREWNDGSNLALTKENVRAYRCYERPDHRRENSAGQVLTAFVVPRGEGFALDGATNARLADFEDGTSDTIMVVEACGSEIVWSEPRDISPDPGQIAVNAGGDKLHYSDSLLSSYHQGGGQVLLADGSVRFVDDSMDPETLRALLTKNGGETIGDV